MILAAAAADASPWWMDFLADAGLGVGLLLMGLAFMKYALPKIVGIINEAFRKMQTTFKDTLTETQTTFTKALEGQAERLKEQRADFIAERALDRESQREATNAAQQTAISQARLSDSMDSLRGEIRVLTGSFKAPTGVRLKPAAPAVKVVKT